MLLAFLYSQLPSRAQKLGDLACIILRACGVLHGLRQPNEVGLQGLRLSRRDAHHADIGEHCYYIVSTNQPQESFERKGAYTPPGPVSLLAPQATAGHMRTFEGLASTSCHSIPKLHSNSP